ncbi:ATP-binding protein [Micromonospora sp. NPDC047187]|uniref:ATP-binding protein n=1 Tax=Micromonospora sp. NPDC047187 TaxID=3155262 RepID=UPI0033BFF99A
MRLHSLKVDSFKNLHNFSISFSASSSVSALVGRNGTGKSNVLEALTLIFRDLDLGQAASLGFHLEYECRRRHVSVIGTAGSRDYKVNVDGDPAPSRVVVGESGRQLRPDFVFGYYSGPSNRLEQHFAQHQERFYQELVNGRENPLRPLFYARAVHSNFVLLAFFLEDDPEVKRLLRDHLEIESLDSVLFELQRPEWKSRSGDPRFWNARGTVASFLDALYARSLAPMKLTPRVTSGGRRTVRREHIYLFLPSAEEVRDLRSQYSSNQDFFKALESTYISDLIFDVRIRVLLRKAGAPLTFRELSEGEQQLLLVLGLMRFTREEESLFLLDEPDTHLNPSWSAQYRRFLERFGGLDERSHVVLASHDPLVVGALKRHEVRILQRGADGRVRAVEPEEDPQGMGVGNLLMSDVYGLRAPLDIETLEKIDRKRLLAAKDTLTERESADLAVLAGELSNLGYLIEDQDPDYARYLRTRYGGADDKLIPIPHFSPGEAARNIADDILGIEVEGRRDQ